MPTGGAPCDVLADEDHGGLGPPRPGDVGDPEAFGDGARIDHDDVRRLAARDLGRPLWRHARGDADALPVEQEPDEFQVPLVGRREDDRPPPGPFEVGDGGQRRRLVGCARSPGDPVAQRETATLALARAQLHDLAGAAARCGA